MARQITSANEAIVYSAAAIKMAMQGADKFTILMQLRAEAAGSDAVLFAANQPPGLNNDTALELFLKLDETSGTSAVDSSGKGRNGTATSNITWVSGKHNNAAQWPASGTESISVPASALHGLGDFTISTVINLTETAGNQAIFSAGSAALPDECRAYISTAGDVAMLYKGQQLTWANVQELRDGANHRMTFAFDNATNDCVLKVGTYEETRTANSVATGQTLDITDGLVIGYRISGGNSTHVFRGYQDDFRIYSRTINSDERDTLDGDPYGVSLSQVGMLIERIDSTNSARFTMVAQDGSTTFANTPADSFPASSSYEIGEEWRSTLIAEYDGTGTRIRLSFAGADQPWTVSAAVPTTLVVPDGDIKIGANTVGGAEEKPFTGSVQDVAMLKGELLSDDERTALVDGEVALALENTSTTKIFHAPLSGFDNHVSDIVSGYIGTYTSEPKRTLGPLVKRLNPLPMVWVDQDPQAYVTARYELWGKWKQRYYSSLNAQVNANPGDLMNQAIQSDATRARNGYNQFAGLIPFLFAPGNHDYDGDGVTGREVTLLSAPQNLPPTIMTSQSSYQDQCDDSGLDAYAQSHVLTIGTQKWHFMTLPFGETEKMRDWAVEQEAKIAAENPGIKTWLVTHASSNLMGELYDDSHQSASSGGLIGADFYAPLRSSNPYLATENEPPINTGGLYGQPNTGTWHTHLSKMSTLAVVNSGHDVASTRKCGVTRMHGDAGNSVDFICLNDQRGGTNTDGDGLMLLMTVDGNTLKAVMYECLTDTFLSSEVNGEFELEVKVAERQPHSNLHLRRNRPAGDGLRRKLSRRRDGVYLTDGPIRIRSSAINSKREALVFSVDTSPLLDPLYVYEVGTPQVIGASKLKAEAVGPRDKEAMVALSGEGIGSEKLVVRFPVTMDTGKGSDDTDVAVIDQEVEVFAD